MAKKPIEYSKLITLEDKVIFKNNTANKNINDKVDKIDRSWIKSVFMISGADLDPLHAKNRYFSSADIKFTDTSMGGNIGINSKPQFTRYADIRVQGRRMDRNEVTLPTKGNIGMGRYYSEAIDDNEQNLYLEFGVPKFNSLFTFFTRSMDYKTTIVASTGRSPIWYDLGKVVGNVAVFLMLPVISVSIWMLKGLKNVILGDDSFNFYYLNPTMHTYWATVNTIVSSMATELGVLIPEFMPGGGEGQIGVPVRINQADMAEMHKLMPDIIGDDNYIDVFAIATRAQLMANRQLELQRLAHESFSDEESFHQAVTGPIIKEPDNDFTSWLQDVLTSAGDLFNGDEKKGKEDDPTPATKQDPKELQALRDGTYKTTATEQKNAPIPNATEYFKSAVKGGGGHAIFKVEYVGSVTESFSNSVTDVPAGDKIKSIAKGARQASFSFAGGNVADGVGNVVNAAKDLAAGALDSLSFGLSNIIPTLFGGAYIDIPKMWEDSSASLPKLTYNMKLISPYGNTISQIQNIYIPLAMIMAGTLPLAAGKASYTSPFICKAFLKGVHNVKLGMITDLSITRGTSNLAFNKQKRALALDVSFSITDFSQLMVAPVDASLFGAFKSGIDDDSVFGRYISTLASRDLLTDMYTLPKAKMRLSKLKYGVDSVMSPAYWGFRTGNFSMGYVGGFLADHSLALADRN